MSQMRLEQSQRWPLTKTEERKIRIRIFWSSTSQGYCVQKNLIDLWKKHLNQRLGLGDSFFQESVSPYQRSFIYVLDLRETERLQQLLACQAL